MADLSPLTALGAAAPLRQGFGPITLTETPGIALVSLTLRRGQTAPDLPGLSLPGPGDFATGNGIAAFWSGPGQWMIEGANKAETDFAAEVRAMAPGASVTEQTDGWAAVDVTGPDAAIQGLLERLVNLPPDATQPGRATRTMAHHMPVYLLRRAEDHLTVGGMRSSAQSLWHALESIARRQADI